MDNQPRKEIFTLLSQDLSPESLEQQIFQLLIDSLDPSVAEALLRCALPHWFDVPILAALLDNDASLSAAKILEQIANLSFIEPRELGGYVFHEEVRARLLQTWHTKKVSQCRDLSWRLWQYFSKLPAADDISFIIYAEALYHGLVANSVDAFMLFKHSLNTFIDEWRLTEAEHLLQLAQEQTWPLKETDSLWLDYYWARLAMQLSDYKRASEILFKLSAQSLDNELKERVLSDLRICLREIIGKDQKEAKQYYQEALTVFDSLGKVAVERGAFEQAETYFQEGLALARALNHREMTTELLTSLRVLAAKRKDYNRQDRMVYNTAIIRKLLTAVFSDEEIEIFCYDYFRPVYDKFTSEMGRLVKIHLLIDYCNRYNKFDELLIYVRDLNPNQYDIFIHSTKRPPEISKIGISSSKSLVEITLRGDLPNFTPELREAAVAALAGLLNISSGQQIRVTLKSSVDS